ncbi:nucleotidyltransferase family protein [Candidatus Oscillochloris fontis]|uniref:nucleotidyltransferase family protein n=1 Tax=Candidatus Oscillochloris fontis TaxID=2496868 RepID=UPI00101BD3E7|nr:nucleotidyltransferase family protein [Candidatus Oscillochloris fontis]
MIPALLLAAGSSRRMGQPKQLLAWQGQPLVRHVARQALAARAVERVIVVLGAAAPQVRTALAGLGPRLTLIENPAYATGQASSLRVGLAALPAQSAAVLVLLVDQPLVTPGLIDHLIAAYRAQPDALALVPTYQGQRGTPTILGREMFDHLRELDGDVGARAVFAAYPDRVCRVAVDDPAVVVDLDTPADYAQNRHGR